MDKQTAKLIARIAENLPLLDKDRMQFWIDSPAILKVFLIGLLEDSTAPVPMPRSILELVGTVVVPATTTKFIARDKFVVNTKQSAKVKIVYVGGNFTAWFLSGDGEIEDLLPEQTLRYHKLRTPSVDGPIIAELGGEAEAETTLSEMFSLMEKQGSGEAGVLLTNGWVNIFYIIDQIGVLRTVCVSWHDVGWLVTAYPVVYSDRWVGGDRVFSRNVLVPSEPSVS